MSMLQLGRMTAGGVDIQAVVTFITNSSTAAATGVSHRAHQIIWYPGYNAQIYEQKRELCSVYCTKPSWNQIFSTTST